jgi:hypothetical protein
MKLNLRSLVLAFFWSQFAGIIIFSVGLGAAVPVVHRIAAPFVCSDGKMVTESEQYSYQPGESTTTLTWLCVNDKTGEKQDISFKAALVAGALYGFFFFALYIVVTLLKNQGGVNSREAVASVSHRVETSPEELPGLSQIHQKLETLQELRKSGLVTELEYEKKKAEILKEL